jgi:hypothetical protein
MLTKKAIIFFAIMFVSCRGKIFINKSKNYNLTKIYQEEYLNKKKTINNDTIELL